MYKLVIERIDPQTEIRSTTVYLTDTEAKLMQAAGVKCENRAEDRFHDPAIKDRPWRAQIPTVDFRRSIESKVYEQVLETLDIAKIIKAANGIE
jgi:hypothetical protein